MISKLFNLTYNELIKQFKKISINIIIVFILLLGIILPLSSQRINLDTNNSNFNKVRIENAEIMINSLKNANTEAEKLQLELALIEKDYYQFKDNNNVVYKSWKDEVLSGYEQGAYKIVAFNKILKGIDKKVLLDNVSREISSKEIDEYMSLSKEELNKKLNELIKINEEKKNIVANNDYNKYLSDLIKEEEDLIKLQNEELKKVKEKLKINTNDEGLLKDLEYIQKRIMFSEKILNIYKYDYNNKIGIEENSWKKKTLEHIKECEEKLKDPLASEEDFNAGGAQGVYSNNLSYEEYKEAYNKNITNLQQEINKDWYSLNNNLPQLEFVKDARTLINGTYNVFIILITLLIILIGGGIVSSEFSKGTIRLLMIRPVARWRILLSKLVSLFIIAYGTIIVSVGISAITSGIILGFNALKIGIIEVVGGEIVTVPYVQYILSKVLISSTSTLFIISLVFMISTLAKNTALAVSISTILYLISMPLTLILGFTNQKWIVKTIIPYINQSMLNLMPYFIKSLQAENGIQLNPNWGSIQLIIVSLIMLIITFVIFQKNDIKN